MAEIVFRNIAQIVSGNLGVPLIDGDTILGTIDPQEVREDRYGLDNRTRCEKLV